MTAVSTTYEPWAAHQAHLKRAKLVNGLGATIGAVVLILFAVEPARFSDGHWVYLLLIPMAGLHTIEEYVWPGGFLHWFNTGPMNSADPTCPLTARMALWTDAVAALVNIGVILLVGDRVLVLMLTIAAVFGINAFFHLLDAIVHGRYSPGMITSALVYLPGVTYVFGFYWYTGAASLVELAAAVVAGFVVTAVFFAQVRRVAASARG
ncbi:HXXEE domain-containing protein [Mycobacterium spongiae]|nr:HXXEE domain-containing protein [Mycobacterium spongiae]